MSFNYFTSEAVFDYLLEAVALVARDGWRLLGRYRFDVARGLWTHRDGPVEPPLRLRQVHYDVDGSLVYERHTDRAPESALADYLETGGRLLAEAHPAQDGALGDQVSGDFEHLRWFELPRECLVSPDGPRTADRP